MIRLLHPYMHTSSIVFRNVSIAVLLLTFNQLPAQTFNWNGNSPNIYVQQYILGVIHKMNVDRGCTQYNYGKDEYKRVNVYSYTVGENRIRYKFSFHWQIDYLLMQSRKFSFTVSASSDSQGCNSTILYEDEQGNDGCNCRAGRSYDLGCVY